MAKIVSANLVPALKFGVRDDALEILRSLSTEPSVRAAYLFDQSGAVLAEYVRKGEALEVPLLDPEVKTGQFADNRFVLLHRITLDGVGLGLLYILTDTKDLDVRARERLRVASLIGILSLVCSALLAFFLQRKFTSPIRELTRAVHHIEKKADYSIRAPKATTDELGLLVDGFNSMLGEIEKREAQLAEQMNLVRKSNMELDQFVYVASHDLKAPLRGVQTLAMLIGKSLAQDVPAEKSGLLTRLQGRIQRMERLLDDLLQYSRIGKDSLPNEMVDCNSVIEGIVQLLSPPAGFVVRPGGQLPCFSTKRIPLEQILRNLIGNGIKHHHRTEGTIVVSAIDLGESCQFSVCDDGPGIDPRYHSKIFQMFQTLKPRDVVEGSGMGLAIVQKHVQEQGGIIQVESSLGAGTCFKFTWLKSDGPDESGNMEVRDDHR